MDARTPTAERFVPTKPPEHGPLPVWRLFVGEMAKNPIATVADVSYDLPYASRRIMGRMYHAVQDPDGIKRVLLDNQPNYVRPSFLPRLLPLIAKGLFGADGAEWKSQRRLMAPVFTPANVAEFMPIFQDVGRGVADRWSRQVPGVVDVARDATGATFDVISAALFSSEHGLSGDEAARHVHAALAAAGQPRISVLLGLADLDPGSRGGREAQGVIRERIAAFIARRQANPDPPPDFMTRLIAAFSAEHEPKEAAQLALHNAVTFLVAGHETTANALAWTFYLLSEQPQAQAWCAEEARAALRPGATPQEVLDGLVYLRWVLEEAMRLYPPAPRIEREAAEDDELGPIQVRKGDLLGIWPWVVHRHRLLWDDPDAFNPENFSPEAKARHHRFQYIPFGAGPRICIGAQFATAEALLIAAEWLARYEFAPAPGRQVEVASDVALRPKGGLPLRVKVRKG
ncbi:cytochrome P450 [Phenylobacterium sp.]|jgi:cytochrome P450|uniref:cytochrome P450 n=1 Tax=Phenylobacterium sp. TaxID=1871053 RepID=UPI002F930C65